MAKIDFSAKEIETLKKAAEEYHKAGAEKAKSIIDEAQIKFEFPQQLEELKPPMANNLGDSSCNACYACFAHWPVPVVLIQISYLDN